MLVSASGGPTGAAPGRRSATGSPSGASPFSSGAFRMIDAVTLPTTMMTMPATTEVARQPLVRTATSRLGTMSPPSPMPAERTDSASAFCRANHALVMAVGAWKIDQLKPRLMRAAKTMKRASRLLTQNSTM